VVYRYAKVKGAQDAAEHQKLQEKTVEIAQQIQDSYRSFRPSEEENSDTPASTRAASESVDHG
jgi:hypothetical protein